MYYRSIADLNDAVVNWLARLPADLDLVVGIPRSGLLVASLISLYRGLPMTDLDGFIEGRLLEAPGRAVPTPLAHDRPLSVLVVDDSVYSGKELLRTRTRLREAALPHRIQLGAVYVRPARRRAVDLYAEVVPHPRAFEWNLMHHPYLAMSCLEIDGVLCPAPDPATLADPAARLHHAAMVDPTVRPTTRLGWLVSSRPEGLRDATEGWLARHGIACCGLSLAPPGETPEAEAARKAAAYRRARAWLFLEGDGAMAGRVADLVRRPVYSAPAARMVYPDGRQRPGLEDHVNRLAYNIRFTLERRLTGLAGTLPGGPRRSPFRVG